MSGGELDHDSVRQLYEEHGRVLLAYACSLLPDRAAAEDVLHQVFLRLLRGGIEISGTPLAYLCRAVRNASFNVRRLHAREVELKPDVSWLESPKGLEEIGIALQTALRLLPEEQREIVVLRVWGQMSFEEAAAVAGIPPNTAASRYRYGLEMLRERLKPLEDGADTHARR